MTTSPAGPELPGRREGILAPGPRLRLVLTIQNTDAGAEAALLRPDQGNAQIPASGLTQKGSKLTLDFKIIGGACEGEMNSDHTEMAGAWTRMGESIPLRLKKGRHAAVMIRHGPPLAVSLFGSAGARSADPQRALNMPSSLRKPPQPNAPHPVLKSVASA